MNKTCQKCNAEKRISDYYPGRHHCKTCVLEVGRKRRQCDRDAAESDSTWGESLYILSNPRIGGEVKVGRAACPTGRAQILSNGQNFTLDVNHTYSPQGLPGDDGPSTPCAVAGQRRARPRAVQAASGAGRLAGSSSHPRARPKHFLTLRALMVSTGGASLHPRPNPRPSRGGASLHPGCAYLHADRRCSQPRRPASA